MRQIATLPNDEAARRLADYLLTLDIETRLEHEPDGWAVWVCDEDRVDRAREELAAFRRDPDDPRYSTAARGAQARRRDKEKVEAAYQRRQSAFHERLGEAANGPRALTFVLLVVCFAVGVASNLGENIGALQHLLISFYRQPSLPEIARGQVWRLVTPIFIHFGLLHLLFNAYMLFDFGGQIEARRGTPRFLLLVLVLAVSSNLAQYYLGPFSLLDWKDLFHSSPLFGGMSGVIYGLFGYLWMKSRFEPELGLALHPSTVVILMVWFFVCLSGLFTRQIGGIANGAHAAGLVGGLLIGSAPHLWRSLWRRR
jgi:GlpG protein